MPICIERRVSCGRWECEPQSSAGCRRSGSFGPPGPVARTRVVIHHSRTPFEIINERFRLAVPRTLPAGCRLRCAVGCSPGHAARGGGARGCRHPVQRHHLARAHRRRHWRVVRWRHPDRWQPDRRDQRPPRRDDHDATNQRACRVADLHRCPGQSITILVDNRAASKITQGVTTEITGEGSSIAPANDQMSTSAQTRRPSTE